jgi:hypothetical protein
MRTTEILPVTELGAKMGARLQRAQDAFLKAYSARNRRKCRQWDSRMNALYAAFPLTDYLGWSHAKDRAFETEAEGNWAGSFHHDIAGWNACNIFTTMDLMRLQDAECSKERMDMIMDSDYEPEWDWKRSKWK